MNPGHQALFHARWQHLRDPHVRTLAWLLDAPGLLDPAAPEWAGRIAMLGPADAATAQWLAALDRQPQLLHAALDVRAFTRLGRYAEDLLAFYLRAQGLLVAQNVQVRGTAKETVGEFDFLLQDGEALLHWEFATKLYLLETSGSGHSADYFVGPNLADSLGAKIRKIMDVQLALSRHPCAATALPQPVARAQALVKGWLFYHGSTPQTVAPPGILEAHCRGFWCTLDELAARENLLGAILPRLSWLAPASLAAQQGLEGNALIDAVAATMSTQSAPVLVSLLQPNGDPLLEHERGFIVPNDWRERARRRLTG